MNVLLIDATGLCVNVICADSTDRAREFYPDHLCIEQQPDDQYGPGWTYIDGVWSEPVQIIDGGGA